MVVVVVVFVDMSAGVTPTSDHGRVLRVTSIRNPGVLDPFRHLAHGSAVVAGPVVVSPVVVRQRDGFQLRPAKSSVLTLARIARFPQPVNR